MVNPIQPTRQHGWGTFPQILKAISLFFLIALPALAGSDIPPNQLQLSPLSLSKPSSSEVTAQNAELRLNQLQFIGTHNSYHIAPDGALAVLARVTGYAESHKWPAAKLFQALDFTHPDLTTQLELGIRSFEFDVHADPEGGRFANPAALRALKASDVPSSIVYDPKTMMTEAGFKVFHGGVDVLSTCLTLRACLNELKQWSDQNPRHFPLIVHIENKTEPKPALAEAFAAPEEGPFTTPSWVALESEIVEVIGRDRMITPRDVQGNAASISDAVAQQGWPSLKTLAGKFVFLLLTKEPETQSYVDAEASLPYHLFFTSLAPSDPQAGWFRLPDPDDEAIRARVSEGKLATVQADTHTLHSRLNNTDRRDRAMASGAQFILTDYPIPDRRFSDYRVRFGPRRYVRCNPITFSGTCPF